LFTITPTVQKMVGIYMAVPLSVIPWKKSEPQMKKKDFTAEQA
jgi:hypothetical protein